MMFKWSNKNNLTTINSSWDAKFDKCQIYHWKIIKMTFQSWALCRSNWWDVKLMPNRSGLCGGIHHFTLIDSWHQVFRFPFHSDAAPQNTSSANANIIVQQLPLWELKMEQIIEMRILFPLLRNLIKLIIGRLVTRKIRKYDINWSQ